MGPRATAIAPDETPQRRRQTELMVRRLLDGHLLATGGELTRAAIAKHFSASQETVRSWLTGRRRPAPEVVRDLARLATVSPVEAFLDLGWLDEADLALHSTGRRGAWAAAGDFSDLAVGAASPSAPEAAARAMLRDETMRRRYTVELSTVESRGVYPLTTDVVAQIRLRPGAAEPGLEDAQLKARLARVVGGPGEALTAREPGFCAVRLELSAFLAAPTRWSGQYSWQGEPGSRTWRRFASHWPAHILVQDVISAVSRDAAPDPWSARDTRPLIFIGGRYSAGIAAALTAEGLGWQYVLVHSGASIGRAGTVAATRRDWLHGPAEAWSEASEHIRERTATNDPWYAVLAVRPHSFIAPDGGADLSALEQLRRCPARVVYVRPSEAVLDWWTARQVGLSPDGEYADAAAAHREQLRLAFARIERTLAERAAGGGAGREDLVLAQPEPEQKDEGFDPYRPELPERLVDDQVRLAWQVVGWLGRTSRYAPAPPAKSLHPGVLNTVRDRLGVEGGPAYPGL
ncbi:MAG TPA: hypothetical protein VGM10_06465 [Actinocrinis sp.]|jgi:hypothetical protein